MYAALKHICQQSLKGSTAGDLRGACRAESAEDELLEDAAKRLQQYQKMCLFADKWSAHHPLQSHECLKLMHAKDTAAGSCHARPPSTRPHLQILLLGQHEGVILIQRAGSRVQGPTTWEASTCSSQQRVGIIKLTIHWACEDQLEGVAWNAAPHQAA